MVRHWKINIYYRIGTRSTTELETLRVYVSWYRNNFFPKIGILFFSTPDLNAKCFFIRARDELRRGRMIVGKSIDSSIQPSILVWWFYYLLVNWLRAICDLQEEKCFSGKYQVKEIVLVKHIFSVCSFYFVDNEDDFFLSEREPKNVRQIFFDCKFLDWLLKRGLKSWIIRKISKVSGFMKFYVRFLSLTLSS